MQLPKFRQTMQQKFSLNIYRYNNQIIIICCSNHTLGTGVYFWETPPEILPADSKPIEIGQAALRAAERVRENVEERQNIDDIIRELSGKSYDTFMKKAYVCSADNKNNVAVIEYWAGKRVTRSGFEFDKTGESPVDDPEAIGKAILNSLAFHSPRPRLTSSRKK